MMNRSSHLVLALSCLMLLASCGAREFNFLERSSPDEFMVQPRAPLTLPPDYTLRPNDVETPVQYMPSAADRKTSEVLGQTEQKDLSAAEMQLLQRLGVDKLDGNIRAEIDKETARIEARGKTVLDKALGRVGVTNAVVDTTKERARIEQQKRDGQPLDQGDVPALPTK